MKNKKYGICQYCKKEGDLTKEHIIPKSKGGCNHSHNILNVCAKCNRARGNMPMTQWLRLKKVKLRDIVARKVIVGVECMIKKNDKFRKEWEQQRLERMTNESAR